MDSETRWIQILTECKDSIQQKIKPLLKTSLEKQPDLGIGAGGDPIKKIDLAAERAIVDTLSKHEIEFTLISEETGITKHGDRSTQCYVTVDPIDGTTNLTRGLPFYATSIAVSTQPTLSRIHAALVTDLYHGMTYTAQTSLGAHRNGKRIVPSTDTSLEEGIVGIDLNGYRVKELAPRLTDLIMQTKHIRHFGANALELCYVADGTIDAFVDIRGKLRTTDMAAAWLILHEAGGLMTTIDGGPLDVRLDPKQKVKFVAAANEEIHTKILRLLKS